MVRIMFPVLEPFGSSLAKGSGMRTWQKIYLPNAVRFYRHPAREYPEFNRFTVRGSYKSSVSSEISLGAFNLPPNRSPFGRRTSVTEEGQDYEVDYNIGRVKILNDAILNSGLPINVSFEDNTLFGFQTKTLLGLRGDYEVNKNLSIGATYMHLFRTALYSKSKYRR